MEYLDAGADALALRADVDDDPDDAAASPESVEIVHRELEAAGVEDAEALIDDSASRRTPLCLRTASATLSAGTSDAWNSSPFERGLHLALVIGERVEGLQPDPGPVHAPFALGETRIR